MIVSPLGSNPAPPVSIDTMRAQTKKKLLEQQAELDISVGNEPLRLTLKAAIDKINEALEADLGESAVQNAADSGTDFSPEAVAERIVSFATGGFAAYAERHGDESQQNQLDGFMDLIRGAIEQGFTEAKDILDGLGVFKDQVAANANRTFDLITEKLEAFEKTVLDRFESEQSPPSADEVE